MDYRNIPDKCPLCGCTDLDYPDGASLEDEAVAYNTVCNKCGASWVQWYNLVYDENTDVMDKDGNEIE